MYNNFTGHCVFLLLIYNNFTGHCVFLLLMYNNFTGHCVLLLLMYNNFTGHCIVCLWHSKAVIIAFKTDNQLPWWWKECTQVVTAWSVKPRLTRGQQAAHQKPDVPGEDPAFLTEVWKLWRKKTHVQSISVQWKHLNEYFELYHLHSGFDV